MKYALSEFSPPFLLYCRKFILKEKTKIISVLIVKLHNYIQIVSNKFCGLAIKEKKEKNERQFYF